MSTKRYVKEAGIPLFDSVGSAVSHTLPTPGKHEVEVMWNVETLYKLKDVHTKREWKVQIPQEKAVGDFYKGVRAILRVGLSEGVIVFHNAGKWSARHHPSKEVVVEGVSLQDLTEIIATQKLTTAIPTIEQLERVHG